MSAFISLAFGWVGTLDDHEILDHALEGVGLRQVKAYEATEGMTTKDWEFSFAGERLPITSRSYERAGWVATTLDMDEELFEEAGKRHGREELIESFIHMGASLLRQLQLRYVFFDEEVEAEVDPRLYSADHLVGITLLADDVPGLTDAFGRSDIKRVEHFEGGVALFWRLDPVPHYRPSE